MGRSMSEEKNRGNEKVYREEGVALLVLWREEEALPPLLTPRAEGRLRGFSDALWREVLSHTEGESVPPLRAAYLANEDAKKRFTTRPRCVRYSLTFSLSENILTLRRRYLVTHRAKTLFSLDDTFRFDAKTGYLLSEKKKEKKKEKGKKRALRFSQKKKEKVQESKQI